MAQMVRGTLNGTTGGFTSGTATLSPYIGAAANANTYAAMAFQLADLDQVATLTGLFDQYRIDKVEVKFVPKDNVFAQAGTVAPNSLAPSLMIGLDFDDNNLPTSIAYMAQYDNVQEVCYGGGGLFVTIYPSVTLAAYAGGAFSGYAVGRAGWIDCSNTGVQHYGMKGVATALSAASTLVCDWYMYLKYFVSFRNTR